MKYRDNGKKVIIYLTGRIDASNIAETESRIREILVGYTGYDAVLDASDLMYISSAGLRIIMKISKIVDNKLRIINCTDEVYEIFSVTGFTDILDVNKASDGLLTE